MRLELGAHLAVISWPSPRAATLINDKNRRRAGNRQSWRGFSRAWNERQRPKRPTMATPQG
jgi:hypothetical protein